MSKNDINNGKLKENMDAEENMTGGETMSSTDAKRKFEEIKRRAEE